MFDPMRLVGGYFIEYLIYKSLTRRGLNDLGDDLIRALSEYVHQTALRKKSSETAIFIILGSFGFGKKPLVERLEKGAPFSSNFSTALKTGWTGLLRINSWLRNRSEVNVIQCQRAAIIFTFKMQRKR